MADERLELHVSGRVQGVGFRWYTVRKAGALGLRGRVRNQPDGTVLVVAEGPRDQLELLRDWTRLGPPSAQVERCHEQWRDATGEYDDFEVGF